MSRPDAAPRALGNATTHAQAPWRVSAYRGQDQIASGSRRVVRGDEPRRAFGGDFDRDAHGDEHEHAGTSRAVAGHARTTRVDQLESAQSPRRRIHGLQGLLESHKGAYA
ncbi:uncharacterized protein TRAVEDRAFT_51047 [Trametes versicolor FP-101664 SS1]|uniref:uncharacterized protein n=1 Tax=Trametes versicolor (strain FP-101664) TaxID=717944 RepID=UPI00046244F9|nr:uncharacterized protein TRAVEDRAFT_51047 [Trametes versicolor FP-101664 SS1]EIW54911.1 hypothetical protein TRAVEDRAFT_51047 [Trametes versicolor FP-101664 SS1]